jgi:hypothetical protein
MNWTTSAEPIDIKKSLRDAVEKMNEVRNNTAMNFTHVHFTQAAWDYVKNSGVAIFNEPTPESTIYGLPMKVFPSIVDLFCHTQSKGDRVLAVDVVENKLMQIDIEGLRSFNSSYIATTTPIEFK